MSSNTVNTKNIDVVILCGGVGRRLQSVVGDRPKPMARIGGQVFLDILIDYVTNFGFRRFILCIGYKGSFIKRHYLKRKGSLEILFSEEQKTLGTSGAIKNAEAIIGSSPFLVMNGDSFCKVDLKEFLNFHLSKNALASLVVTKAKKRDDYGVVTLKDSQRIVGFNEKVKSKKDNFVSTGIYIFEQKTLSLMPVNRKFSLEKDFFPKIVDKEFYGYIAQQTFIDIGTPKRYERAKNILSN